MQLAFCSNAYTRFPLEEAIDRVARVGYAGIELLCDRPHYWPAEADGDRAVALRERLGDAGLIASNINANTAVGAYGVSIPENVFGPSLASGDPQQRRIRMEHARGAIELARTVGARCVSLTGGAPESDHPPERALRQLEISLRELLVDAEEAGVRLGLEAEPGLLLERSAEIADLCERIDHPLLGFNLDVGHAVVMGEDPAAVVREHGARIWHLHLEDIRDGKHFHRIPGEGEVDFAALFVALAEVGFEGFASVELYAHKEDPDEAARRALAHLTPLLRASAQ